MNGNIQMVMCQLSIMLSSKKATGKMATASGKIEGQYSNNRIDDKCQWPLYSSIEIFVHDGMEIVLARLAHD
jgi:hypothetical protein